MDLEFLINHVKNAISNAYNNRSKLANDILSIEGFSGNKKSCNLQDFQPDEPFSISGQI